jgi:hypothetical protein
MKNFRKYLINDKEKSFPTNLINEGLIKSWDYDVLKKYLLKLLKKYNMTKSSIDIEETGLYLIVKKDDVNKKFFEEFYNYLHISGFYISNYFIDTGSDNDKIEKGKPSYAEIFSPFNEIEFTLNKKFDTQEKGIPVKMYHVTEEKFIPKIERNGLVPKTLNKIEKHPDRIYLFDSKISANFYKNTLKDMYDDKKFIIIEINTKMINKIVLYNDPKFGDSGFGAYYTYSNISPLSIKILK